MLPCSSCPSRYHLQCIHPPVAPQSRSSWRCPVCTRQQVSSAPTVTPTKQQKVRRSSSKRDIISLVEEKEAPRASKTPSSTPSTSKSNSKSTPLPSPATNAPQPITSPSTTPVLSKSRSSSSITSSKNGKSTPKRQTPESSMTLLPCRLLVSLIVLPQVFTQTPPASRSRQSPPFCTSFWKYIPTLLRKSHLKRVSYLFFNLYAPEMNLK